MSRPALIGDIGGTNARFALVTPGENAPTHSQPTLLRLPGGGGSRPGLFEPSGRDRQ